MQIYFLSFSSTHLCVERVIEQVELAWIVLRDLFAQLQRVLAPGKQPGFSRQGQGKLFFAVKAVLFLLLDESQGGALEKVLFVGSQCVEKHQAGLPDQLVLQGCQSVEVGPVAEIGEDETPVVPTQRHFVVHGQYHLAKVESGRRCQSELEQHLRGTRTRKKFGQIIP